ncbi:MAG TPA: hypothetical protein VIY49_19100 [Bryobacteraceae bacterium]
MNRIVSFIAVAAGLLVLAAALEETSRGQVPVRASMVFVDSDAACPAWPAASPYTLSQAPNPATSLQIFVNGVLWSAGEDFSLNGAIVTLVNGQGFSNGDVVTCRYRVVDFAQ